ncbi:MAG: hypothetical protein R3F19_18120 [Verrucomicrobiales bacterium]
MFDLRSGDYGLTSTPTLPERLQVVTCEICTAFGTVFGQFDESGRGHWHPKNERPAYLPDDVEGWGRLPENNLTPGAQRSALFAADQFLPTTFSQLGGHPTWIQDSAFPECPDCIATMLFLGQIDRDDIEKVSEGVYYAFLCPTCRTTATAYQQT